MDALCLVTTAFTIRVALSSVQRHLSAKAAIEYRLLILSYTRNIHWRHHHRLCNVV